MLIFKHRFYCLQKALEPSNLTRHREHKWARARENAFDTAVELAWDGGARQHHATKRLMMIQITKMSGSHFHYPY